MHDASSGIGVSNFSGHKGSINALTVTPNSRWAATLSGGIVSIWEFDWDYEFESGEQWTDNVLPYLESFLLSHVSHVREAPSAEDPGDEEIRELFTPKGRPSYNEQEFQVPLRDLKNFGYGWIHPERVNSELTRMASFVEGKGSR